MASVSLDPEVRYTPLLLVGLHLAAVVYLSSTVGRSLYRSYAALRPVEGTGSRVSTRVKLTPVFAGFAIIALLTAGYSAASYAILSYKDWATHHGIEVPNSVFGSTGENGAQLYLARWLADAPAYRAAMEIFVHSTRRFWWKQQLDVATASWSMLLAVEGRRRRITGLWTFMLLAHLVNLSFAQNLFYVALLLAASPLTDEASPPASKLSRVVERFFPEKPANWCPNPILYLGILIVYYVGIFTLPYVADRPYFQTVVLLTRLLTFAPLATATLVPESWGTVHAHPHSAIGAFTDLFRYLSVASLISHGRATIVALIHNLPDTHYDRHSGHLVFHGAERSNWDRTTTTLGRLLGATADHPVVAAAVRDVLLCGLSLGVWAAVRAIDVSDILTVIFPPHKTPSRKPATEQAPKQEVPADDTEPLKSVSETPRRRAKPRQNNKLFVDPGNPSNGPSKDEAPTPNLKRRGRPHRVKADPEDETYAPSPEEKGEVAEGDQPPAQGLDWESAALVWGVTVVGGLGTGCACLYGAECVSQ